MVEQAFILEPGDSGAAIDEVAIERDTDCVEFVGDQSRAQRCRSMAPTRNSLSDARVIA
jgi:hypothetical protein